MTTQLLKSRRIYHVPLPTKQEPANPLELISGIARQLERAEEKTAETLETIELLEMLRRNAQHGRARTEDFKAAHRALVRAGLESGELHTKLCQAEEALRNGRQLMPAAR